MEKEVSFVDLLLCSVQLVVSGAPLFSSDMQKNSQETRVVGPSCTISYGKMSGYLVVEDLVQSGSTGVAESIVGEEDNGVEDDVREDDGHYMVALFIIEYGQKPYDWVDSGPYSYSNFKVDRVESHEGLGDLAVALVGRIRVTRRKWSRVWLVNRACLDYRRLDENPQSMPLGWACASVSARLVL